MIIGIPTMGTIPVKVAAAIGSVNKKYPEHEVIFTRNSLVYDARHTLMQYALKNDTDLLFIDSDIYFTLEALERLCSHKKPIVSGLYFQKSPERKPVAYKTVKPRTILHGPKVENIDEIQPFMEVAGVGLGFCLIRNEVLKAFDPNRNPFEPFGGLGEDFSFFVRCKKKGFKVYLDTTLNLKHLGEYEYGR